MTESVPLGPSSTCGGLAHTNGGFTLLAPTDDVTRIVTCGVVEGYFPGDGIWTVVTEHRVPDDQLPSLVDALQQTNFDGPQPPANACTAYAVYVPMFTVTTADGRVLQGSVPSDGCHPQLPAVDILRAVIDEQPATDRWRTVLVQDQTTMTTGCGRQGGTLVSGPTFGEPTAEELTFRRGQLAPSIDSADGAAVCLYGPPGPVAVMDMDDPMGLPVGGEKPVTRQGAGLIDAGLRDRLLASIVSTAPAEPAECLLSQPWPPAADGATYLQLLGLPTVSESGIPETDYPYVTVELGPCGRAINARNEPIGWADPAVVREVRSAVS